MLSILKSYVIFCVFQFVLINNVSSQAGFDIPQNIELNTRDDYAKYESKMIEAAKWLEQTDLDKETEKRQRVNKFVLQWVAGSPTINIVVHESVTKLVGKNKQLLSIYLANYSRYCLESKSTKDPFPANKAALESMMNVYKKGISIKRTKEMDKLIKMTEEGKLNEYIQENVK
ncbi:MAG TPA: hypothetical protein VFV08_12120 [Puia sp.]|nr:hypothetical protein [Puia sp.]